ncbi:hypothetical protein PG994_014093 [Apiospora phragmitis]|uniref:Exonuclease domain-containing protein n=1 Tax=Apiospora phragmitis TaxID=2905665 RepID=A0ABR1T3C1_9PEZI
MQTATAIYGVSLAQSPEYVQCLRGLVHSPETLKQKGFIIDQLSASELERRKRCQRCCRALITAKSKRIVNQRRSSASPSRSGPAATPGYRDRTSTAKPFSSSAATASHQAQESWGPPPRVNWKSNSKGDLQCKYHPGKMDRKTGKWTCCNMSIFTKPCQATENHDPRQYRPNELEENWHFHHTPLATSQTPARVAVVFDCEMGVSEEGESELIRVSIVDYFSSDVLLDSLVWPDAKMKDLSTAFSGVSWKALNEAHRNKTCLLGREQARKAVWSLLSPETVVIGHGAKNDLDILRWIHPNIVDTQLVEQSFIVKEKASGEQEAKENQKAKKPDQQNAETKSARGGGGGRGMSLKKLARERLDRAIQTKGKGHDSIEDSIATRDLLHWHVSRILQPEP